MTTNAAQAEQRAQEVDAIHPRPRFELPAHPDENLLDAVIQFAWRIVKWNLEEILEGHTANRNELPKRQAEARVLAELHRTLDKFTRLKKSRASEKQDERTDAELSAELLENFRKVLDASGT
jgi:hypothetical protein